MLSDASEITVLAVLIFVFESEFFLFFSLLFKTGVPVVLSFVMFQSFFKVFCGMRGIISSFINAALMSWFFSFISSQEINLT